MSLIEIKRLKKVFVTEEVETHALSAVDLTIQSGEFVAIEGASGSGKSTLLAILGLLDVPTEGTYRLGEMETSQLSAEARAQHRSRSIGFVFQNFNLIGDLTVEENVELPLIYQRVPAAERRVRVTEALERVALSHRGKHMPSQLSGGQQQRVAVARAVVGKPLILLADEPTGNLDSQNAELIMELLRELYRQGTTLCMVTHHHPFTHYATRTLVMSDGRIVSERQGSQPVQARAAN